jgi:cell division protein FtsL
VTEEYGIKRDVRNMQIVRELDRDRQRELWRTALVIAGVVTLALFSAWQHFELRRLNVRILELQQERTAELMVRRHLRLEIAALRSPRRIEETAMRQLHMTMPESDVATIIERVTTTAPPPGASIVASR